MSGRHTVTGNIVKKKSEARAKGFAKRNQRKTKYSILRLKQQKRNSNENQTSSDSIIVRNLRKERNQLLNDIMREIRKNHEN